MAMKNVGGHGVSTSAGGSHNMSAQSANPPFSTDPGTEMGLARASSSKKKSVPSAVHGQRGPAAGY